MVDITPMQMIKMRMIQIRCGKTPLGKLINSASREWTEVEDIDEQLRQQRTLIKVIGVS